MYSNVFQYQISPTGDSCPIRAVPRDVLCVIFGYVIDILHLIRISETCKSWNLLIWSCVKKIPISLRRKGPWCTVKKMTRIRVLEVDAGNSLEILHQSHIDDVVGKLCSVRKLCVERCNVILKFDSLEYLANLESLSLYDCLRIEDLRFLEKLAHLSKLCLSKCFLGDTGLERISNLNSLQQLFLWHTHSTDEGINFLSKLIKLNTLDISGNPCVTESGIQNFSTLTKLELFDVSNTQITNDALHHLKHQLKNLQIGYKELYGNPLMQRSKKLKLF